MITLQDILRHRIVGNAMSDAALMDMIDLFVCDESKPMDERTIALSQLDVVMGVDAPYCTEKDVEEYVTLKGCQQLKDVLVQQNEKGCQR